MLTEKSWKAESLLRFGMRLFACMAFGMLAVGLVRSWLGELPPATEKVLALAVGATSFHVAILVLTQIMVRDHQWTWSEAFGFRTPNLGRSLGLGLLTMVLAYPVTILLSQVSELAMRSSDVEPVIQQSVQTLQQASSIWTIVFFGIVAVVLAPVAEEVLFRGILYTTLKQMGYPRLALWGGSVMFALSHANVLTTLSLIAFSLMLTRLYENTGNLLAPILAHSLFNGTNFIWLVLSKGN